MCHVQCGSDAAGLRIDWRLLGHVRLAPCRRRLHTRHGMAIQSLGGTLVVPVPTESRTPSPKLHAHSRARPRTHSLAHVDTRAHTATNAAYERQMPPPRPPPGLAVRRLRRRAFSATGHVGQSVSAEPLPPSPETHFRCSTGRWETRAATRASRATAGTSGGTTASRSQSRTSGAPASSDSGTLVLALGSSGYSIGRSECSQSQEFAKTKQVNPKTQL